MSTTTNTTGSSNSRTAPAQEPCSAKTPQSVADWAAGITLRKARGVNVTVELGRYLAECKAALKGHWMEALALAKLHVGTADTYMRIAHSPVLSDSRNSANLPPATSTLDALTRLEKKIGSEELQRRIDAGTIDGRITEADVEDMLEAWRHDYPAEGSRKAMPARPVLEMMPFPWCNRVRDFMARGGELDYSHQDIPTRNELKPDDNGLTGEWSGRVFVHAPSESPAAWVSKCAAEFDSGRVEELVLLVPAETDAEWWPRLAEHSVCFSSTRPEWVRHGAKRKLAACPQALVYFGPRRDTFVKEFSAIGVVMEVAR